MHPCALPPPVAVCVTPELRPSYLSGRRMRSSALIVVIWRYGPGVCHVQTHSPILLDADRAELFESLITSPTQSILHEERIWPMLRAILLQLDTLLVKSMVEHRRSSKPASVELKYPSHHDLRKMGSPSVYSSVIHGDAEVWGESLQGMKERLDLGLEDKVLWKRVYLRNALRRLAEPGDLLDYKYAPYVGYTHGSEQTVELRMHGERGHASGDGGGAPTHSFVYCNRGRLRHTHACVLTSQQIRAVAEVHACNLVATGNAKWVAEVAEAVLMQLTGKRVDLVGSSPDTNSGHNQRCAGSC